MNLTVLHVRWAARSPPAGLIVRLGPTLLSGTKHCSCAPPPRGVRCVGTVASDEDVGWAYSSNERLSIQSGECEEEILTEHIVCGVGGSVSFRPACPPPGTVV